MSSDFGDEWPEEIEKERLRSAFSRYCKERQVRSRLGGPVSFGKALKKFFHCLDTKHQKWVEGQKINIYRFPTLEQARKDWQAHIGHEVVWDT